MQGLGLVLMAAVLGGSALMTGLIHLVIALVVLAIVYFLVDWLVSLTPLPAIIRTLLRVLFACIAAYYVIVFLLALV